jgi:small-conductance mechanosensitive channel
VARSKADPRLIGSPGRADSSTIVYIEIDWRATRFRTFANDMVVIPNSVIAKAIVTNHRKLNEPHISSLSLKIDQ